MTSKDKGRALAMVAVGAVLIYFLDRQAKATPKADTFIPPNEPSLFDLVSIGQTLFLSGKGR